MLLTASVTAAAQSPDAGVIGDAPLADPQEETIALMDGRIGALEEQLLEAKSAVEVFTRLKFTG